MRGSPSRPRLHGDGDILDYAVKMRQFPQRQLLSSYAEDNRLEASQIDAIAETVARVHDNCEQAPPGSNWGSLASIEYWCAENLSQLQASVPDDCLPAAWTELQDWYRQDDKLSARIASRQREGFVRECHGDLHLGNMAMIDDRVTLFDCIEFNPELRWIDTVSEAAFVAMDLQARGYPEFCWRFLDRYLAAGGDYAGIDLLRYYVVYRALVRAKVEALRVATSGLTLDQDCGRFDAALGYLELANSWAQSRRRGLILMHGLSGSGKSTVAARLVESLGAIRLRSDVERKRLFGLAANQSSGSAVAGGIYGPEASERTYRRLAELARDVMDADHCVIVDAAFLKRFERRLLLDSAASRDAACVIVACRAPQDELERRLKARKGDASEADLAVLQHQLQHQEPIGETDIAAAPLIEVGTGGLSAAQIEQIEARLFD